MEENEVQKDNLEEVFRKEILKNTDKELSKEEIKKLTEEARESIDFLEKIETIELPTDKYVIFTDGDEQLFYEGGEFYVVSSIDSTVRKKKKTKKEATDMYLDYFIKYQLNPILDQRDIKRQKLEIMQKEQQKAKEFYQKAAKDEKVAEPKAKEEQIVKDDLTK